MLLISPQTKGASVHTTGHHYSPNILLRALSLHDLALVQPYFVREKLNRGLVLIPPNKPIEYAWFPEGGVVSIVAELSKLGSTEVGVVGREGFAGTPLLLGADRSLHDAYVQVDGGTGLKIDAARLVEATEKSPTLRATLLRYIQTFMTQAAYSAVSNAHQRIEGRLARWLLMCHDREDGDEIALTHEFMAMMISADRSSVTVTLHILEGSGMIRSTRGKVLIIDRLKLEQLAGEHYDRPEAEYRRLIAPFGKSIKVERRTNAA